MATFAVASPIATMSVIRRSGRIRKDMMFPRTKNPIAPATGKVQFPVVSTTQPNTMGEMIPAIAEAALSIPLAVHLPPCTFTARRRSEPQRQRLHAAAPPQNISSARGQAVPSCPAGQWELPDGLVVIGVNLVIDIDESGGRRQRADRFGDEHGPLEISAVVQ